MEVIWIILAASGLVVWILYGASKKLGECEEKIKELEEQLKEKRSN